MVAIDPSETRSPQAVLFDLARCRARTSDQTLEVLFEAIAKDLPGDLKLAWLVELGREKDMEKFSTLLNTLEPEWVRCRILSLFPLFMIS